ncbi:MAG: hypothetical protein J7L82_03860 [Staphylothermus sp.]|nr:hypothetical protein [Staphylothermus sp.]
MPSHMVHRLLASRYLGVSEHVVAEVDRIIDLGTIHDIGRRKPRRLPAYLDIVDFGEDVKKRHKEKLRKVKEELEEIFRSDVKAKVFYYHHGLDILANRLASAIMLGLKPEKICGDLVKGTLYDLEDVKINLVKMGVGGFSYLREFKEELRDALYSSCIDKVLINWVNDNVVPKYKQYKSLDYIKERLHEIIPYIEKSDARYRVGYTLGLIGFLDRLNRREGSTRVKGVYQLGRKKYVISDNELISKESIERELESYHGLSSYGYGRLRRTIVILASLYSDIYHLPFIEPLPLEITFDMLLSVRKKRYTMARNVLRCYEDSSKSRSEARECALREMERALRAYVKVVGENRVNDMKKRFIEAIEELMDSLKDLV